MRDSDGGTRIAQGIGVNEHLFLGGIPCRQAPLGRSEGKTVRLMDLCRLGRWSVSLVATLSAVTGALVFSIGYARSLQVLVPATGTILLAMGASAFNQVQERDIDARMERTRRRPLPAGRLTPRAAGFIAGLLLGAGLLLLALRAGWVAACLGAGAVAWYNGVYTPLKRVTPLAVLPGALVGAVPPAIGWVAAGGSVADPRILALCVVLFLWQVPHFWLILLRHGREYEAAGLPSLTSVFEPSHMAGVTLLWLAAAGSVSALLPLFAIGHRSFALVYVGAGLSLPVAVGAILGLRRRDFAVLAFRTTNVYLLLMMGILALDRFLWVL